MLENGWSTWFALAFEAKLLNDTTDEALELNSFALDEIYFMDDCALLTSESPETTNTPATTAKPSPNVRL